MEAILISTHNIPSSIKKEITLNYPKSTAIWFFSKGLENEFDRATVNDPSVFEPMYDKPSAQEFSKPRFKKLKPWFKQ